MDKNVTTMKIKMRMLNRQVIDLDGFHTNHFHSTWFLSSDVASRCRSLNGLEILTTTGGHASAIDKWDFTQLVASQKSNLDMQSVPKSGH